MNTQLVDYDPEFVYKALDFDWLPDFIDRGRLFNIAFEPATGSVKLYFLSATGDRLYKTQGKNLVEQHDALAHGFDWTRIETLLGGHFDPSEIQPDTIENGRIYLYIEPAGQTSFTRFVAAFARVSAVSEDELRAYLAHLNQRELYSWAEVWDQRALSLVRLSLDSSAANKIYTRPLLHSTGWQLDEKSLKFFSQVYNCSGSELLLRLQHIWVSMELGSGRVVLANQHHHLHHED